jgi:hypothetical protein
MLNRKREPVNATIQIAIKRVLLMGVIEFILIQDNQYAIDILSLYRLSFPGTLYKKFVLEIKEEVIITKGRIK